MNKKLLDNRFFTLCIFPFIIGSLSVLSFQPFNLTIINFIIFPIFFYTIVYISKRSHSVYRKKPFRINLFTYGLFFGLGFYLSGISWIRSFIIYYRNIMVCI